MTANPRIVRPRRPNQYRRLNGYLGVYVVASAALCALPVGMNRPVPWLIWAGMTAVAAALYVVLGHLADPNRRLISRPFWPMLAAALIVPIWAMVQSLLPVAIAFPAAPDVAALAAPRISALPAASILASVRFTAYILFFFLAIEVAGRASRANSMGHWIFWAVAAHAVWALVALNLLGDIHIWGAEKTAYLGFATGTFVNRNSFAAFLAMGGVLGFTLLQDRRASPLPRKAGAHGLVTAGMLDTAIMALGLVAIWAALLATSSRMGVFSGAIGTFLSFAVMRVKMQATMLRGLFIFACAATLLGAIGIFTLGQELAWRSFLIDRDLAGRVDVYRAILALIGERPFVGYGFDAFRAAFEWSAHAPDGSNTVWDRAHSTYLSHWMELGVLVGSLPIVLIGLSFARAVRLWRRRSRDYALPVAALAVIATQALHSLVDFGLEMPANVVLFLAIIALGIAPRQEKTPQQLPR